MISNAVPPFRMFFNDFIEILLANLFTNYTKIYYNMEMESDEWFIYNAEW